MNADDHGMPRIEQKNRRNRDRDSEKNALSANIRAYPRPSASIRVHPRPKDSADEEK
jgi:hypothetical protein